MIFISGSLVVVVVVVVVVLKGEMKERRIPANELMETTESKRPLRCE